MTYGTRPGSHFRIEPVGRELRVMLMAACGATIRFMATAEQCSYQKINGLCWRLRITPAYAIDMDTRKRHGEPAARAARAARRRRPGKPDFRAFDQWMRAA